VDKRSFKKNFGKSLIYFLLLYFGLYITFTVFGDYDDSASLAKEHAYGYYFNREIWGVWEPRYLVWDSNNWNFGGLLFSPLINWDRWLWHKNQRDTDNYLFKNH
jgi:hypothetical protein